jgi:hypothetical protein
VAIEPKPACIPIGAANPVIDPFAAHQWKRYFVVDRDAVEGISQDLEHPDYPPPRGHGRRQSDHAEQATANSDEEPDHSDVADEVEPTGGRGEQAEQLGNSNSASGADPTRSRETILRVQ